MLKKSSKSSKKNASAQPLSSDADYKLSDEILQIHWTYKKLRTKREDLIRLLKGNYRIARVKTELDHYLAEESDLCRRLEQFENKIDRGVLAKAALTNVEKCNDYTERLKNHRSYIEQLFEEKKQAVSGKYVTFEKSSVSSFTSVTGEEENLGASNVAELPKPNQEVRRKNSTPLETESSEKRNSEHLDSQVTPKSTFKSYLDADEAAHVEKRRKECQRELVEKLAELKRKKMQIEFVRAQREYEERMKKRDEETQLQIMEAELGTLVLSGDEKKSVKVNGLTMKAFVILRQLKERCCKMILPRRFQARTCLLQILCRRKLIP